MVSAVNYTFKFAETKLDVDIDNSFSAARHYAPELLKSQKKLLHYHAKNELFFVGDEPLEVCAGGVTHEYRNCLVFIPPFYKHYSIRGSDYRLLFSYDRIGGGTSRFFEFLSENFASNEVVSLNTADAVSLYIGELDRLLSRKDEFNNEVVNSLLRLIFYNVYLANRAVQPRDFGIKESYLITIESMINRSVNPESTVNMQMLAAALHLSTKQASRVIFKHFGKNLSELVTERRLTIAEELIVSSDMSISEVAKRVNFHSENHFYHQFKKMYGCTPLQYRKKHRQ